MNYPHQQWRLLVTPPSHGAWNMAMDEAVLEAVGQSQALPSLRLYAWEPPCLSIGYAQPSADVDLNSLSNLGWDWVRRPTGGRAILHTDELTYSVIVPLNEPRVSGGVIESYQRLSKALLAALHSLNIPAEAHPINPSGNIQESATVCFEAPSNYEIVVHGKKLIGNAQARRKNGVLQHGTLPLSGDLTRITQVLVYSDEQSRRQAALRLLSHATTVETVLGYKITWETVAKAFTAGFQSELDIELVRGDLSDQEIKRTERLEQEKYSHPSWLERI
ncbi:MAG: biotin/lipoate A/B protein ligase family protein [Anaerolineales bacterium]